MLDRFDPLSLSVTLITLFNDKTKLGTATGFYIRRNFAGEEVTFLVTNWHVLAGRDAINPMITRKDGLIPSHITIGYYRKSDFTPGNNTMTPVTHPFNLYRSDGTALWYQHPRRHEVDIAVIETEKHLDDAYIFGVDHVADAHDMKIEVSNDVIILGYPFAYEHIKNLPIWKRGMLACEPNFDVTGHFNTGRVVVDATTRKGMSGSPVLMRYKTHYVTEAGDIVQKANATRFLGVYAQRPLLPEGGDGAEIGYFYRSGFIHEILEAQLRGPNYGVTP